MRRLAFSWVSTLAIGAILCACTSQGDSQPEPRHDRIELPALLLEREVTALTGFTAAGTATFDSSGGAQDLGSGRLQLAAGEEGFTYALYRFNLGDNWPGEISIVVEANESPYYVALPDYVEGRWQLAGPYLAMAQLQLDSARSFSPAENLYCAVVVSAGDSKTIEHLELSVDIPDGAPRLVASLAATPDNGDAPLEVTLDASGSHDIDGKPLHYEWEGDGNGQFELDLRNESLTKASITDPGEYIFRVKVRNADGLSATAAVTIVAHGWARVPIMVRSTYGVAASSPSLALVDGHPAIAYTDGDIANYSSIHFAIANSPLGAHEKDWNVGISLPCSAKSYMPSLAVVQGNPAVAYEDRTTSKICYSRSTTTSGEYYHQWSTPVIVDTGADVQGPPSLAVINGRPAVAYVVDHDSSDGWDQDLKFAWSSSSTGESADGWSSIFADSEPASDPTCPSLCEISGRAAIAYQAIGPDHITYSSLRYAICTLTGGATEDSWTRLILDDDFPVGQYPTLLDWLGSPAVIYSGSHGEDSGLRFIRAVGTDGRHSSDWIEPLVIDHDPTRLTGAFPCAAVINGKLVVAQNSWNMNADRLLRYTYVTSGVGDLASDWSSAMVFTDMQVDTPQAIADINGHVAIAFPNHIATGGLDLWYCILF